MKKLLFLTVLIFVFGCGSRKVNKKSRSIIEENQNSITNQTKITEIEFDRKKLWELIYKYNFKADNITIHPDGRVDISQPVIDSERKEANQEQLKEKVLQTESESKIDEVSKKEDKSQNKNVDKKQFDWTGTFLLMIFIVVFGYKFLVKSK